MYTIRIRNNASIFNLSYFFGGKVNLVDAFERLGKFFLWKNKKLMQNLFWFLEYF